LFHALITFAKKFLMKPAAVLTGLLLPTFALAWSTTVLGQVAAPIDIPSRGSR
jgi:hypothetical protein